MVQEIHVLDKKVRLLQPDGGFRTSLDSVMLAAAVPAKPGDHVLDAGCGVGGAGFCLLWRVDGIRLTGIDIQGDYIDLARQNNDLNERQADFIASDIREFKGGPFDHVMINPPFFESGAHTPSPDSGRAIANGHQDETLSLDDWIRAAHRLVRSNGSVTIIYPASGTERILQAFSGQDGGRKFGAVELIPLWPKADQDAKRVIIRAVKDRQTPAKLRAGLVLHNADGSYTREADAILRHGERID